MAMTPRTRGLLIGVLLVAAVSRVQADFDPFAASRNAVIHFGLRQSVPMASMLCDADLVHWGELKAGFAFEIVDPRIRSTFENFCALVYGGQRAAAVTIAYALLAHPAAQAVPGLEKAVHVILEMPAKD
jgi:hypothetical protein